MKIIEDTTLTADNSEKELGGIIDVAREVAAAGQDSAFLVCDLTAITGNHQEVFERGLNNHIAVKPRFDIFCNCAPLVLRHLCGLGFEFRARNKNEIKLAASAGVPPARLTLDSRAGLVASHLRYATSEGVGKVVVRTPGDIKKVKKEFANARILLSLSAPTSGGDNSSIFDQGSELLRQSAQLGLGVAGLAFEDVEDDATLDVRKQLALVKLLLAVGRGQFGHEGMDVVHLGEVGKNKEEIFTTFDCDIAEVTTLTVGFSDPAVASAFVLCTKIIGMRASCNPTIVINEGVFGHFGKLLHSDRQLPNPRLLWSDDRSEEKENLLFCDILGPSGDDADVIGLGMPIAGCPEVEVGDWIAFPRMGSEVLTPANPKRTVSTPVETGSCYWLFTSDVENGADNQTNKVGGFTTTIEAEDCLAAAECFAVSLNDTQMAEMLTGLK